MIGGGSMFAIGGGKGDGKNAGEAGYFELERPDANPS
jgi:hypothetical protein